MAAAHDLSFSSRLLDRATALDHPQDRFCAEGPSARRAEGELAENRLPADQYGFRGKDTPAGWPVPADPDAVEAARESGHVSKSQVEPPGSGRARPPGARLLPPSFRPRALGNRWPM